VLLEAETFKTGGSIPDIDDTNVFKEIPFGSEYVQFEKLL
jgi:hypothetical protein